MKDAEQHTAQPNKIVEYDGKRITFKPIYQHPFNGWEIVSVEEIAR